MNMDPEALNKRNFYVEKHNLVLVCRFVIKSVIDKASVGDIDEDGPETINLLATVEHILNHNTRVTPSLFNSGYTTFWSFIKDATSKMENNCVSRVLAISSLKSNTSKGRAWLRLALMEKRLAEYLKHAISQPDMLRKYYSEGAIIVSEEMQLLIADLIGLEAIDFNFCLRDKDVNLDGRMLVDYSPYLRFEHCIEGIENDMQEIQESGSSVPSSHSLSHSSQPVGASYAANSRSRTAILADKDVKERLASLQRAFRTTSEQKGYLEQILKKSELELATKQAENNRILTEKSSLMAKHDKEVRQLENVILELQSSLGSAKTDNRDMQSVINHLYKRMNGGESNDRAASSRVDNTSVYSDNLSMDELALREDNSSLQPMFGSLLSESESLTASYDSRGSRRMAESAPTERPLTYPRNRHGQSDASYSKNNQSGGAVRVRTTSELNQETTSRYITNGASNTDPN